MRVLVCGGRDYKIPEGRTNPVGEALDGLWLAHNRSVTIIEGGAKGVDALAREWARKMSCPLETYFADWDEHGKAAGPIRNQRMIDEGKPDLVVAFPGGRGTADMVRRARAAGIEVIEVE